MGKKKGRKKAGRKSRKKRKQKKAFPKWLAKYHALRLGGKSKKAAYKEAGAPKKYWD